MKKRIWIASILAGLSVTAVVGGVSVVKEQPYVTAAAETWQVGTMDKKYLYGTVFNAPEATVEVNGQTATATATVTYPNGLVTTAENVELNQEGTYTLTYRAVADGVHCVEEKQFFVEAKAYLTQKDASSVSYGTYTNHGANTEGLIVRLAKNDTLTFSQLIDFNALGATDILTEWFVTPDSVGARDFEKLTFRFTDAVDPSHYLEFSSKPYEASDRGVNTTYTTAAGDGQTHVGKESGGYTTRGAPATHSFVAQQHEGNSWSGPLETVAPGRYTMRFYFNTRTMEASTCQWNGSPKHIAYLDDLTAYEKVWEGLPSGKARLTITADKYMGQTANFVIKSIFGISDLSQTWFDENGAPELDIAMSQDEMPVGEKGLAYKLPEATAFDYYSGNCAVKTSVYRDYSGENRISVGVSNGKFVPTTAGWYTIEYTSSDLLGNEVTETRNVYVSNDLGDIEIALPAGLPTEVELGNFVATPVASYTGDCGLADLTIKASLGEESYDVTDGFVPEKEGEWKITYIVTDYLGRVGTAEHTMTAKKTDVAQLLDEIHLPKIFLSDSAYVLPALYAKDYSTGVGEEKLCTVVVTDKNGDKTYNAGDVFTPCVETNGDLVKISYQYNGQVLQEKKIPTILSVKNGKISGLNYFYGAGFTTAFKDAEGNFLDDGVMITASTASERVGWTFATPQFHENLAIDFQGDKAHTSFSAMELTLIDAVDESLKVSLTISVKLNGATITSGNASVDSSTSLLTDANYKVTFTNGRFYFGDASVQASTTEGEVFKGFNSEFVYVQVDMLNAEEGASYKVFSVSRSNVSRRNLEVFKPSVQVKGDLKGEKGINEILEVFPAIACDVFAPEVSLTVTVFKPDGSVATDVDGNALESVSPDKSYFVHLTEYGNYRVVYDAVEKNWVAENKFSLINTIFVVDGIRPQAVFLNAVQTTAKLGDVLVMPDVAVRDNVSAVENIVISRGVLCPNGKYWKFDANQNALQCTQVGDYVFSAHVFDERGNMTVIKHTITVTE